MILPADIGDEADKLNQAIILRQLNADSIFDVEMQHQENDILELHFAFKADPERFRSLLPCHGDYLVYAFKFKKGRWEKINYDPYQIGFDKVQKGKILKPFRKS